MTFTPDTPSRIATLNSSSVPLGGGLSFTGTGESAVKYGTVTVTVISNVDSAPVGVVLEGSPDNTTWRTVWQASYHAGENFARSTDVVDAFVRVTYNNGGSPQGSFVLQTLLQVPTGGAQTAQTVQSTEAALDSFGRLRVSAPLNLLEASYARGDLNTTQFTSVTAGTGSLTLSATTASADLSVVTSGDSSTVQTRSRAVYQPGKSLMVAMTGVPNVAANAVGVASRMGFFDDDDGVYLEHTGDGAAGTLAFVNRSSKTGTVVNTPVAQADWNMDRLDGTGPSGLTLDTASAQIMVVDFEWLGVGRVRCGFFFKGQLVYANEALHSNIVTQPYINTATQPCRYQISSAGGGGTMRQICCSATSEGGHNPQGRGFSADTGNSPIAVGGTEIPGMSLRLKSTGKNFKVQVRFTAAASAISTNGTIAVRLGLYRDIPAATVLTGASWVSANAQSAVEYDRTATAFSLTGRILISTAYLRLNDTWHLPDLAASADAILTSNVLGLSDIVVASVINLSAGSEDIFLSMSWVEEY